MELVLVWREISDERDQKLANSAFCSTPLRLGEPFRLGVPASLVSVHLFR